MKYDVEGIFLDREEGLSLRDIAQRHGVGKSTIKRVLDRQTGVVDMPKERACKEIYNLSVREIGVLGSEESAVLNKHMSSWDSATKKAIRRMCRARGLKEGKECLFIPDWLGRESPKENRDSMMVMVDELHQRIVESVEGYMQETGCIDVNSVRHMLLSLSVKGYSDIPVEVLCRNIDNVIFSLGG